LGRSLLILGLVVGDIVWILIRLLLLLLLLLLALSCLVLFASLCPDSARRRSIESNDC
jgi:hypothetical protein